MIGGHYTSYASITQAGSVTDSEFHLEAGSRSYSNPYYNVQGTVSPARGTVLTSNPNWESPFTNSNLAVSSTSDDYSLSFAISEASYNPPVDTVASGYLTVTSISVSGPITCYSESARPFPVDTVYMFAQFSAPSGTLANYAAGCGFDHFNWQQQITQFPYGSTTQPRNQGPLIASGNVAFAQFGGVTVLASPTNGLCASWVLNCSLVAPPPFLDPPEGGYTYQDLEVIGYPYYYASAFLVPGGQCTLPPLLGGLLSPCRYGYPYVVSLDDKTLSFADGPANMSLPSGQSMSFRTELVGVDSQGNPHVLDSWTWQSTYNGTAGGVSQTALVYQIDPGSGTGGVVITSLHGVQFPTFISSSQLTVTASGLAYSRVSQTFNGTVTLTNISSTSISGPLQIVFFGMPPNVTLVNATANLSGTPYLTVPAVTSLGPGQSVTVNVQFKNPSNATINLSPVIYSGSIN